MSPELRSMQCDICGKSLTELIFGAGFTGWGSVKGISTGELPGQDSIILCPKHLKVTAEFLNKLEEEE